MNPPREGLYTSKADAEFVQQSSLLAPGDSLEPLSRTTAKCTSRSVKNQSEAGTGSRGASDARRLSWRSRRGGTRRPRSVDAARVTTLIFVHSIRSGRQPSVRNQLQGSVRRCRQCNEGQSNETKPREDDGSSALGYWKPSG